MWAVSQGPLVVSILRSPRMFRRYFHANLWRDSACDFNGSAAPHFADDFAGKMQAAGPPPWGLRIFYGPPMLFEGDRRIPPGTAIPSDPRAIPRIPTETVHSRGGLRGTNALQWPATTAAVLRGNTCAQSPPRARPCASGWRRAGVRMGGWRPSAHGHPQDPHPPSPRSIAWSGIRSVRMGTLPMESLAGIHGVCTHM